MDWFTSCSPPDHCRSLEALLSLPLDAIDGSYDLPDDATLWKHALDHDPDDDGIVFNSGI